MRRRKYSKPAADRRAMRQGDDKAHDERVWEAERKRLAAEAQAAPQRHKACLYCVGKGQVQCNVPGGWAKCGECGGSGHDSANGGERSGK